MTRAGEKRMSRCLDRAVSGFPLVMFMCTSGRNCQYNYLLIYLFIHFVAQVVEADQCLLYPSSEKFPSIINGNIQRDPCPNITQKNNRPWNTQP